ncbi:MAG: hypothetical protein M3Q23_08750 [Actinomycetota bacterium]|nr:hypothetical protein [Actinomycetota bacterium]
MARHVARALDRVGLYRPLARLRRRWLDPERRWKDREIRQDLRRTRAEVRGWGRGGAERADPGTLTGILSFTNLPLHAKFQAVVAKAAQLQGMTPVVLNSSGNRFAHRYFRLFGVDRVVMWDHLARELAPPPEEVAAAVARMLPARPTVRGLMEQTYHGVDVGKHALSMTCRRRLEGRLDLDDPATVALLRGFLADAVRNTVVAERFLDRYPLRKMLVRDAGYIPNGEIYEAALARGVDCFVYEQGQRRGTWVLKRYTPQSKGEHYFSLSDPTWQRVLASPWTEEHEALMEREFANRYLPDSTDDTRRLMSGKREASPREVRDALGLDPGKKTAVIFSHMAWDAAFFFGTSLYEDFETWLFETVKFVAAECPDMNWIVKLHPFNVFKLQREGRQDPEESEMALLRRLMPLPEHVRIMRADTPISTRSLFPLVDYVLTVNGTVGMEFPCFGVPAVVAGTGRYSGRGFTVDPASQQEYLGILRRLHQVPPLSDEVRALARRHFLALMMGRQVDFDPVAPMELKRINEAQSDVHDNIGISARSLDQFASSPPIRLLSEWLVDGTDPDLMQPLPVPAAEPMRMGSE